ncbi:MAG: hypothetical protein RLY71_4653 [Pseudomonadota bacterium]|jgi:RND family efflux transporter MFP subunit
MSPTFPLRQSALGAATLALALTMTPAAQAAAVEVPVLAVSTASAQGRGFELEGTIQPVRQAVVASQVGGNVVALLVKAGDRVKAGQVLARVDERDTQAGLSRGNAAVAQAQAELANVTLQAERTRELRRQGYVSQSALDQVEAQLKAAQAGLQQAQAGQSQAALARGFAQITAPFDGIVQATLVEQGDLATPGRPVASVYAPQAMRAVVQIGSSRQALALAARDARGIRIDRGDGPPAAPQSVQVLPGTDPVAQTVEWRLNLGSAEGAALQPGQTVRVRFEAPATAGSPASAGGPLRIPASALLRRGELTAVYVVRQGRFALTAVRIGNESASGVEILTGLRAGEQIARDAIRAGLADAAPAAASH